MIDDTALTPQEVADILKIAKNTVYELVKRGELKAYRVGKKIRVESKDVEAYKNRTSSMKNRALYNENEEEALPAGYNPAPSEDGDRGRNFIICGQDIMLDIMARNLQMHPSGLPALRSYIGSYNSLYALYCGHVQVATAHLWDGDTGRYNISYVRRMLPGIPAVIVHLACRMQGFYVARGNPRQIKGWEDLERPDICIVNREKGSGTRILLDEHLRLLGIPARNIRGYKQVGGSHLAVAGTVARGGADVGLGNEKAGLQVRGIDFIPLQSERFELVMLKEDLDKPEFQLVMNIIRSREYRAELEALGGYDLKELGRLVAET